MLIASRGDGARILAHRELDRGDYFCPVCETAVVFKRGRVVVPHFAHGPGSDCPASESESPRHLQAKLTFAERFASLGYTVQLEETHRAVGRRVDVAVILPGPLGVQRRVAVEVQDSPIQVETMKDRVRLDRRIGYDATAWVFTSHRAGRLMDGGEARIPPEMRWVANRYGVGIHVIDSSTMWNLDLDSVHREGETYTWYERGEEMYEDYPGRTLRATKTVTRQRVSFRITASRTRFSEWAIQFVDEQANTQ